jgi:hypothetical protein
VPVSTATALLGPLRGLAFGVSLARRGIMSFIAIAISIVTTVVLSLFALMFAVRGGDAPVHDVPILASSAIAWGGGFLQAFAVAAHALHRDRTEGIRQLYVARTTSLRGYVLARVGGLAAMLGIVVGGGTLLSGLIAILASTRMHAVPKTLHATLAAVVFALAFAAVVAPVAFAALGARTRVGGYLFLLGIIVLPEVLASALSGVLPIEVTEVIAIPSALGALRSSLAPGSVNGFRFVRAIVALTIVIGIALAWVRRDAKAIERAGADA